MFRRRKRMADDSVSVPLLGSCRLTVCIMNGLVMWMLYLLRINLSMTIVCMVHKTPRIHSATTMTNDEIGFNSTEVYSTSRDLDDSSYGSDPKGHATFPTSIFTSSTYGVETAPMNATQRKAEFTWTRSFQGHVLSAYYYGYLSTLYISGRLAGRYGGRYVLSTGLIIASVATLLIPPAVRFNKYLIIVLRIIVGAGSGVILPTALSLAGVWFCPFERSFLTSLSRTGITLGSIVALLTSAHFCGIPIDNGWPLSFYATGGAGVVCWLLWIGLVYSSPEQHPRISSVERQYIAHHTCSKGTTAAKLKFPWFKAITSPAVLAVMAAQTTTFWFVSAALTSLPLYIRDVLSFDIKKNGLFSVLPHLLVLATNVPAAYLADTLLRKGILSTTVARKIFQSIASFGSSALLIALIFMDYERRYLAVALLTCINPIESLCRSGYCVSVLDFAPRFSGEIYGLVNTVSTVAGLTAPVIVGYLTTNGTKQEWQTVFYIATGLFAFGGLIFLIFSRGTLQSWADLNASAERAVATVDVAVVSGGVTEGNITKEHSCTDDVDSIQTSNDSDDSDRNINDFDSGIAAGLPDKAMASTMDRDNDVKRTDSFGSRGAFGLLLPNRLKRLSQCSGKVECEMLTIKPTKAL